MTEYRAANPDQTVTQLEANPWRAYGPGWTPQIQETLQAALEAAGGS